MGGSVTSCVRHRSGPLAGPVLEVGVFMAAPFAAMQLADLGADVVKVENPDGGEPVRSTGPFVEGESSPFLRLNRGKRSVALDLKSDDGKAAFLALVDHADVLVENLRPGAMRRLGLGFDDLSARNPRLVYASASGFGQDGPLADRPGLDIMAQARGGLMSITGHPDGPPAKVGVPVADLTCGLYVAIAVLAALRERETSGQGQYVDVSLLESAVSLAVWEAGRYWATGEVGGPLGSAHQSQAPYQAVPTSDGWLTLGAITPKTWAGLCAVLGLEELVDDPRFALERTAGRRDELLPIVEERTQQHPTAERAAGGDRRVQPGRDRLGALDVDRQGDPAERRPRLGREVRVVRELVPREQADRRIGRPEPGDRALDRGRLALPAERLVERDRASQVGDAEGDDAEAGGKRHRSVLSAKASRRPSASGRSVRPKPSRKWLPGYSNCEPGQEQDALGLDELGGPVVDPDAGHGQPREADRPGRAAGPT